MLSQEQMQSSFEKINFILAIPGHQLLIKNIPQAVIRYVLLFLCFSRLITSVAIDTRRAIVSEEVTLYHFSDISLSLFTILFHIMMLVKRSEITKFLTAVLWQVDQTASSRLRRVTWTSVLFYWLSWLLQGCITVCIDERLGACIWKTEHLFEFNRNVTAATAIASHIVYLYEAAISANWMLIGFACYNFCHVIKDEVIRKKYESLVHILRRNQGKVTESEYVVVNSIMTINDLFDQAFCFIPFLVLAANFMQTSGYLLYQVYTTTHLSTFFRVVSVGISLSYTSVSVAMCFTSSPAAATIRAGMRVAQLLEREDMSQYAFRFQALVEKAIKHKNSGWLFELENKTLLSYAGHIMSFAIIFLQLMPSNVSVMQT
jgi:hypothetical protein